MAQMAGPDPIWTICPNCNTEILTTTEKSNSTLQMLVAGGFCLFAGVSSILSIFCVGFPLCFCIPFCMDDWKDVLHTCPNCNYVIFRRRFPWSFNLWHRGLIVFKFSNILLYRSIVNQILFSLSMNLCMNWPTKNKLQFCLSWVTL